MIDLKMDSGQPGLLVSVRSADEALAALDAGASVIDVKEPTRGSLGAADAPTIAAVVEAVAGRVPVSAALGELDEQGSVQLPKGIAFIKIGLAGCGCDLDWSRRWQSTIRAMQQSNGEMPQPVAVAYADWRAANAPNPEVILRAAIDIDCPGLLIDTWDKSAGGLFDHWATESLRNFLDRAREQLGFVVLAGSLAGVSFRRAVEMLPNLVAVRGAACETGREGPISARRIRDLMDVIRRISPECDVRRTFTASELLNTSAPSKFP